MSHEEMHSLRIHFVCKFPDSGLCNMTSKTSRTTNFSEQEKLLLAELGKDFPEVESKGYDRKTLTRKAKAWEEILTRFNSQIPNGIKHDLSRLQGCSNSSRKKSMTYIIEKQEILVAEKFPPPQVK